MLKNNLFKLATLFSALIIPCLVILILLTLLFKFIPYFQLSGLEFFTSSTWNINKEKFGILVFLTGTLLSSLIALIISIPFSLSISIVIGEILNKNSKLRFISHLIEIISAIPSVVIGLWALAFLFPIIQKLQIFFNITPYGVSLLTASLVLSFYDYSFFSHFR